MARGSPGKRVARAAATGGGRTKRGKAPIGFYSLLIIIVLLGAATVGFSRYQRAHPASASAPSKPSSPATDPLKAPVLASTQGQANGQPVDGIACQTGEQLAYHVHAHLAVYSNGALRAVPRGIGITPPTQEQNSSTEGPFIASGSCFYWLHTHTQDGIIHIESPTPKTYNLGNFFDIWGQPLTSTQVSTALGNVTAYVNGKQYTGDPRSIPLTAHAVIQLDVGSPTVPPKSFSFPQGL
jgi:hypothetical protein